MDDSINNDEIKIKEIYQFVDYREFLKDRISFLKETLPTFSYRNFNRRAGMKSPAHLKLIMDGKRNLTSDSAEKICKGFRLSKKESRFFHALVNFCQAGTYDEKNLYYQQLVDFTPKKSPATLQSKYYKIYSNWYYLALMEVVRLDNFREDYHWIANKLKPPISVPKAKHAMKELEGLGLISRDEAGRLKKTDEMLATPNVVRSLSITEFHEQLMELSKEAVKMDPVDDREFSAITMAISTEKMAELKDALQEFRRKLHRQLEEGNNNKTEVVNINLGFIKLTKSEDNS